MNAFFHSEITTRLSRENREFDCNIFTDGQPKYRRLKNLSTRWTLPPIYRWLCWLVGSTITDPTLRKIKSQLTDMDTFAVVRISQISSSQRSREGAFFTSYVIYSVGVKCLLFSFSVLTHLKQIFDCSKSYICERNSRVEDACFGTAIRSHFREYLLMI